jgi:acyl-CoA synthetase (NDP forming)
LSNSCQASVSSFKDMTPLLRPESVAIVGCEPVSAQLPPSWPLRSLLLHQAPVHIYPVNPSHRVMDGLRCYPALSDVPNAPDLVLVMTNPADALDALEDAEAAGAKAAILFGAIQDGAGRAAYLKQLSAFAHTSSMAVLGPNSNGMCNAVARIPCTAAPFAGNDIPRGNVALVSQSGGVISSIVERLRRGGLGLSLCCSTGMAVDVGQAEFLNYLSRDPETHTILVYIETITGGERFLSGAKSAVRAGKQVIVLKAGRSLRGSDAVRTHTGSLVGPYEYFRAACESSGILTADTFEEFVSMPALLRSRQGKRTGPGTSHGVGIVAASGGIAALLADRAAAAELDLPQLSEDTNSVISQVIGSTAGLNPIDLSVHDRKRNSEVISAVAGDSSIGHIVFGSQSGPEAIVGPIKEALAEAARFGVSVSVWSTDGSTAEEEPILSAAGISVDSSADVLLAGLGKILARERQHADRGARPSLDAGRRRAARTLLREDASGPVVTGSAAWRLLALYGIPSAAEHPAGTAADACRIARHQLGFPVAAKLSHSSIPHRSRLGLVELGLESEDSVRRAFGRLVRERELLGLPAAAVVIQKMAPAGLEAIVSVRAGQQIRPCVLVGAGGVNAEELNAVEVEPAPFSADVADRLAERFRKLRPCPGAPGPEAACWKELSRVLCSLGGLAVELREDIDILEINPLILSADGAIAVDVLATRS